MTMTKLPRSAILILLATLFCTSGCLNPWKWHAKRRAVRHYASAIALQSADFDYDAMVQLREAVELDDEFSLAYSMLGDLYRQNGQYNQAATAYEKACVLDPWAFDDHFHLGQVYQMLQRFKDAINILGANNGLILSAFINHAVPIQGILHMIEAWRKYNKPR